MLLCANFDIILSVCTHFCVILHLFHHFAFMLSHLLPFQTSFYLHNVYSYLSTSTSSLIHVVQRPGNCVMFKVSFKLSA